MKFSQLTFAVLLVSAACASSASAQVREHPHSSIGDTTGSIILLPLANYTGRYQAIELAREFIQESLDTLELSYLTEESVRPLLRENRIRAVGEIGVRGATTLAKRTGARWLLSGSIDVCRVSRQPEYALSLRLIDAQTHLVDAAASGGHSCRDFDGVFGKVSQKDLRELARITVNEVVKSLATQLRSTVGTSKGQGTEVRVCIVPFGDSEPGRQDGGVVSDILLSALVQAGYSCVEPGAVRETFLNLGRVYRGEIDLPALQELAQKRGVQLAVTGTVENFQSARGASRAAVPYFALSARILAAKSGCLVDAFHIESNGKDSETLFQRGRTYSLVKLSMESVSKFMKRMEKVSGYDADES